MHDDVVAGEGEGEGGEGQGSRVEGMLGAKCGMHGMEVDCHRSRVFEEQRRCERWRGSLMRLVNWGGGPIILVGVAMH